MSENYLKWLKNLVCRGSLGYKNRYFGLLLDHLYSRIYTFDNDLDGARAKWGLALRDKYVDENRRHPSEMDGLGPCSMLEMMVALAWRMENEEASERWDDDFWDFVSVWFWGMIDNMGLGKNDDGSYDPKKTDICIDRVLGRGYNSDGRGGLFTLKRNFQHVDMTKIDFWRQAMLYMAEIAAEKGELSI